MKPDEKGRSTGEMISSAAFFGFSLWLLFEARSQVEVMSSMRTVGLYFCAAACFLAAFRFLIADMTDRIFRNFRR